MTIARPVALRREWPQTRSARAIRQATALGTPTPSNCAVGAHAREPTQWPHACDRRRATHRALPACPPSYADYILRLQDTKPESLEIMLRLLIVALPLVVAYALPAAFDEQEANAIQFEVQYPLQLEVRSISARVPPESRPLLPAAPREINTQQPRHTLHSARTTPTRTHHHARAAALERGQDDPPRYQLRHETLRAQGHQQTTRRCAARPGRHAARAAFGRPCRCAQDQCTCCRCTRARARRTLPRLPQLSARRGAPASARRNLRSPSADANAPPRLFC
jgi:hypothetical protein